MHAVALQPQKAKQVSRRNVLIVGPVSEGVNWDKAIEEVTEIIRVGVQPAVQCEVIRVSRMERFSELMQGFCRIRVCLCSAGCCFVTVDLKSMPVKGGLASSLWVSTPFCQARWWPSSGK